MSFGGALAIRCLVFWGANDPSRHVLWLDDHQNRRVAISMYSTHAYDVRALRLSAQATPSPPRHSHLSDTSLVGDGALEWPVRPGKLNVIAARIQANQRGRARAYHAERYQRW